MVKVPGIRRSRRQCKATSMAATGTTSRIRRASSDDADYIRSIARVAFEKYTVRIGREPAPMVADFVAAINADRVAVIETAAVVVGYGPPPWPAGCATLHECCDEREFVHVRPSRFLRNTPRVGGWLPPRLFAVGSRHDG